MGEGWQKRGAAQDGGGFIDDESLAWRVQEFLAIDPFPWGDPRLLEIRNHLKVNARVLSHFPVPPAKRELADSLEMLMFNISLLSIKVDFFAFLGMLQPSSSCMNRPPLPPLGLRW
jgi:hypothetical protein